MPMKHAGEQKTKNEEDPSTVKQALLMCLCPCSQLWHIKKVSFVCDINYNICGSLKKPKMRPSVESLCLNPRQLKQRRMS